MASREQNIKDAARDGLMPGGKGGAMNCKLSKDEVEKIRFIYETSSYTYKELAARFNVSESQIGRIVNKKNWSE